MFTDYSPITDDEVEYIHQTLRDMKALDTDFWVSGADWHQYTAGPPLSEQELLTYERKWDAHLPVDYRSFLLRVGTGGHPGEKSGAGPGCGLTALDKDEHLEMSSFHQPFPYTKKADYNLDVDELHGCINIGYNGGDSYLFLVVNGPVYGTVWEAKIVENVCEPTGKTFGQWYGVWLGFLNEVAAPKIRAEAIVKQVTPGMRRSDLIALCSSMGGNLRESELSNGIYAPVTYHLLFDDLISYFVMEPAAPGEKSGEDKVKRVIHSHIDDGPWVFGSRPLSQKRGDGFWGR